MIRQPWWRIGGWVKDRLLSSGRAVCELFYPRICTVCGESLVKGEEYLCTACLADFPFSDQDYATQEELLLNFDVACRPEKLFSLFYYNKFSPYKNLIYRIKYRSHRSLGVYLGRLLGEKIKNECEADCIIPVPLHPKREKERGFNQAREIAVGMAGVMGVDIYDDVLFRVRNNASQTGKNASERLQNVEHIFELRDPVKIIGKQVLLVDDVITTGATVGACLQVLSQAGNVRFCLGCLAQTV